MAAANDAKEASVPPMPCNNNTTLRAEDDRPTHVLTTPGKLDTLASVMPVVEEPGAVAGLLEPVVVVDCCCFVVASAAMHDCLCCGQCDLWQPVLQYQTLLHLLHRCSPAAAVPHTLHCI